MIELDYIDAMLQSGDVNKMYRAMDNIIGLGSDQLISSIIGNDHINVEMDTKVFIDLYNVLLGSKDLHRFISFTPELLHYEAFSDVYTTLNRTDIKTYLELELTIMGELIDSSKLDSISITASLKRLLNVLNLIKSFIRDPK